MSETPTVSYWAISMFSSRTIQMSVLTFVVGVLALPEVVGLIPLRFMPSILAVTGIINFYLRTITVRPVAAITPGSTKAVEVARLGHPDQPLAASTD